MKYKNKKVPVDPKNTIYSMVDLPETDEEIYAAVLEFRERLGREEEKPFVYPEMIKALDSALAVYEKTHDISKLLQGYGLPYIGYVKNRWKNEEGPHLDKELNGFTMELLDYISILAKPELRAEYDAELQEARNIQAIEDESKRNVAIREKIIREQLQESGADKTIDKSHLGGDKKTPKGHVPQYGWSINLYKSGKRKIMDTRTYYKDNPYLSEKVEVYAHGGFRWEGLYRTTKDGTLDPTVIDDLCEIVSIRKTDSTGKVREFYGIAQTKELGHIDKLDLDELEELEAKGIDVLFLSDGKKTAEAIREGRTPDYDGPINRIEREKNNRTIRTIAKVFRKIGLQIPEGDEVIAKEPRMVLRGPKASELKVNSEPKNKKYTVLVMQPKRTELSELDRTRFAKLYLSDYLLGIAKEKNGYFIGNFGAFREVNIHRLEEEAIRACQFATKNPGKIYGVDGLQGPMEAQDIGTALEFVQRVDRMRTKAKQERGYYGE